MNCNRIKSGWLLIGLIVCTAGISYGVDNTEVGSKQTKKRDADAKKSPAKNEWLKNAVADLTREFREFANNPTEKKLREKSDYFNSPPGDVTVDQTLAAIERRVSSEPLLDAYIRWQLMSAVTKDFDLQPKQIRVVLNALRSAPQPLTRYGASQREQQDFAATVRGAKQGAVDALKDKLAERRAEIDLANSLILNFRDSLFPLLPRSYDSFALSFDEARLRADAGIIVSPFLSRLIASIHSWVVQDNPTPSQIRPVLDLINRSKSYQGAVATIRDIAWDARLNEMRLNISPEPFGDKTFDDIIQELKEAMDSPNLTTPKFKDDKSRKK